MSKTMERMDTINQRMAERNKGSIPPIYFSPRPVPTKYVALPILDQRVQAKPIPPKVFDVQKNFFPATTAPGYSHYVDTETTLMRDTHYFPSSTSSLYTSTSFPTRTEQTHPLLFTQPTIRATPRGLPQQWWNESTHIKS